MHIQCNLLSMALVPFCLQNLFYCMLLFSFIFSLSIFIMFNLFPFQVKYFILYSALKFHPPRSLALLKIEGVSLDSPCLFGKGTVVHARQTCRQLTLHLLKPTSSETIKPIDNSCMLSSNPSINPVVCWYYFLMLVLIIV